MQSNITLTAILLLSFTVNFSGCAPIRVPVPVDTGNTAIASYTLKAGVPAQAFATISGFSTPLLIGNGSLTIDPGAISLTPTSTNKKLETLMQSTCSAVDAAEAFIASCLSSGSSQAECEAQVTQTVLDCLGNTNTLEITGWIHDDAGTLFTDGDKYGPYLVTFDENGQGLTVSPNSIELTENTIALFNGGSFVVGFKLVIGQDATITVDSFTVNVGL